MPTNLSEKIKFINRQNELKKEMTEAEREASLVKTVEQVWADEDKRISEEETATETFVGESDCAEPEITNRMIWAELQQLKQIIEPIPDTLTKINKHINATQKALKKEKGKK